MCAGNQAAEGAERGAFAASGGAEEDRPWGGEGQIQLELESADGRGEAELVVRGVTKCGDGQEMASCRCVLRA